MQAIDMDRHKMILFSSVPIPEWARADLVDRRGGRLLDGITLVEPEEDGDRMPNLALYVSRDDDTRYELAERGSADLSRLRPLEAIPLVIRSRIGWEDFLETLGKLEAMAGQVDESDTDAAWDEVDRNLGRAR